MGETTDRSPETERKDLASPRTGPGDRGDAPMDAPKDVDKSPTTARESDGVGGSVEKTTYITPDGHTVTDITHKDENGKIDQHDHIEEKWDSQGKVTDSTSDRHDASGGTTSHYENHRVEYTVADGMHGAGSVTDDWKGTYRDSDGFTHQVSGTSDVEKSGIREIHESDHDTITGTTDETTTTTDYQGNTTVRQESYDQNHQLIRESESMTRGAE
ncbi:hypothetical protein [Streptomyces sp. NPDC056291]|uniref:hypothetical protein n=1 Tax=Streptomyces sp. NPDC056291 TaxID=3345772 RepID=UPI0035DCADB8